MSSYSWPPASSSSGSNASVGTNGAAIPTSSTLVAGEDPSLNLKPLQTDASGNLLVNVSAGLTNPLPVTDSVTHTDLATINTTLGSPFQVGGSIGNTSFIATQGTGTNLHTVVDNFPATQPISGTVTANQGGAPWSQNITQVGGSSLALGQTTKSASIPVTMASDQLPIAITTTTGSMSSLNASVDVPTRGYTATGVTVTGTWAGAIQMYATVNGTDWALLKGSLNQNSITVTNNTSDIAPANNGQTILVKTGGYAQFRVKMTTWISGTANVTIVQTMGEGYSYGSVAASLYDSDGLQINKGQQTMTNSLPVVIASNQSAIPASQSGTWNITNVSGTVSLPTGAATAVKQPALGTAGTASADVITVQGIASMTALKVDGSAVTQPVKQTTPTAGTVTQAAISVGVTAVRLTVSGSAPNAARSVLVATVDSAATAKFYIGSSSVASSGANRGIQIFPGQPFVANYDAGDYYIISDTATQTVYVMEQA